MGEFDLIEPDGNLCDIPDEEVKKFLRVTDVTPKNRIHQINGKVFDSTRFLLSPDIRAYMRKRDMVFYGNADAVVAIESGGLLFGPTLADQLEVPLILARRHDKLIGERVIEGEYERQGGKSRLCLRIEDFEHVSARMEKYADGHRNKKIYNGPPRIVICDDAVASGATAENVMELCYKAGGRVIGISAVFYVERSGGKDTWALTRIHTAHSALKSKYKSMFPDDEVNISCEVGLDLDTIPVTRNGA